MNLKLQKGKPSAAVLHSLISAVKIHHSTHTCMHISFQNFIFKILSATLELRLVISPCSHVHRCRIRKNPNYSSFYFTHCTGDWVYSACGCNKHYKKEQEICISESSTWTRNHASCIPLQEQHIGKLILLAVCHPHFFPRSVHLRNYLAKIIHPFSLIFYDPNVPTAEPCNDTAWLLEQDAAS